MSDIRTLTEPHKTNPVIRDLLGQWTAQDHLFRTQPRAGGTRDRALDKRNTLEAEIRNKVHELDMANTAAANAREIQTEQKNLTWQTVAFIGLVTVLASILGAWLTAKLSNDTVIKRIEDLERKVNTPTIESPHSH